MTDNKKIISIENKIPELKRYRKKKLIRHLAILVGFFAVLILITLYFLSPFSKVDQIYVSGNRQLTENEIRQASGVDSSDFVIAVNNSKVEKQLEKQELIKKAVVEKDGLRNLKLKITEYKTVGYMEKDGMYYDILENGKILNDNAQKFPIGNRALYVGFKNGTVLKDMVEQMNQLPEEVIRAISEVHLDPKKSDAEHIVLYMNDGNQVSATIPTFAEKMSYYPSIVAQLQEGQKGVINLEVGAYFESYYKQNEAKKSEEQKKD
ncbi:MULTISPECIES: cell division protein FtsQ/DivIB [Listeria]|uniref:cell division protein FtsQ/DivIB n=1 Tax=Listeria TaxID=1637 RepID=UPI000B59070F|nr:MULTISPECIES: cell division protein FtsQ/DivIB [Listeria]